jgi:hypothetical protein
MFEHAVVSLTKYTGSPPEREFATDAAKNVRVHQFLAVVKRRSEHAAR